MCDVDIFGYLRLAGVLGMQFACSFAFGFLVIGLLDFGGVGLVTAVFLAVSVWGLGGVSLRFRLGFVVGLVCVVGVGGLGGCRLW